MLEQYWAVRMLSSAFAGRAWVSERFRLRARRREEFATWKDMAAMKHEELSKVVLGCALEVHKTLGPGLLESAYERCLVHELEQAKVPYALQVALPIEYKGVRLDCEYRADLIVDETILVELKSCEMLLPVHEAQLLTYMKLAGMPVGLLINFNVAMLKDGIKRMVL